MSQTYRCLPNSAESQEQKQRIKPLVWLPAATTSRQVVPKELMWTSIHRLLISLEICQCGLSANWKAPTSFYFIGHSKTRILFLRYSENLRTYKSLIYKDARFCTMDADRPLEIGFSSQWTRRLQERPGSCEPPPLWEYFLVYRWMGFTTGKSAQCP